MIKFETLICVLAGLILLIIEHFCFKHFWLYSLIFAFFSCALFIFSIALKIHEINKIQAPTWADFLPLNKNTEKMAYIIFPHNDDGAPSVVFINGERWYIVEVAQFSDTATTSEYMVAAKTFCDNKTIAYLPSDTKMATKEHLWHEIFHAGACLHGGDTYWNSIKPTQDVHPGVKHLGQFMSEFASTNPDFMIWAMKP